MAFKIPKPTYDPDLVAAIEEHLCQEYWTEIDHNLPANEDGLVYYYAVGADTKTYSRPIFQLFKDGASSSFPADYTPCPDCDDFAYTSNCETHYELGWDSKRHDFNIRQRQPEPAVAQSPSGRPLFNAETLRAPHPTDPQPLDGLYGRIMQFYGQPLNLHDESHLASIYRRMLTDEEERISDRVSRLPDATLRIDGIFNEGTVTWEYDDDGA